MLYTIIWSAILVITLIVYLALFRAMSKREINYSKDSKKLLAINVIFTLLLDAMPFKHTIITMGCAIYSSIQTLKLNKEVYKLSKIDVTET